MRKMFTRLFSLALLLMAIGITTELSAQCNLAPVTNSNVNLLTDPTTVCDSGYVTYEITGYTNVEYAFNYDGDGNSGWGGFTTNNQITVKEGVPFSVVVRDPNVENCETEAFTYTNVELVAPVTNLQAQVEHPQCYGMQGEITINHEGGQAPFTYYLVPAAEFSPSMTDLSPYAHMNNQIAVDPGTYYAAVQDVAGCVDLTDPNNWTSGIVVNAAPSQVVINSVVATDPTCIGGDGQMAFTVSGGVPEYKVMVGANIYSTSMGSVTIDTVAGEYNISVMDANGCEVTLDSTVTIADPAEIKFNVDIVDVTCADGANGEIKVNNVTGLLNGNFEASLDNVNWVAATSGEVVFSGLTANYYSIYVRDADRIACGVVEYVNPNSSGNVIAVQAPGEITFDVTHSTITCNGGQATITVSNVQGGSGSYEYQLEDANGVVAPFGSATTWTVSAGTGYKVVVRDAIDATCEIEKPVGDITEPSLVTIDDVTVISPTCPGGNDGVINVSASGGNGTYKYSIDNVQWYDNHILAVPAGTYTVYVKDPACPAQMVSTTVTVDALDENVIKVNDQDTFVACNGADDAFVTIGVQSWADQTGSDNRVITYYMDNGSEVVHNTTGSFTDLAPGTYIFWAEDNYGCVSKNKITKKVTEAEALAMTASVTSHATCFGDNDGIITVSVSGGTSPISYGHANTQTAALSLAAGAYTTWPTGQSTVDIQVGKGTYWVVVKDACGVKKVAGPFVVNGYEAVEIAPEALSVVDNKCKGDNQGEIVVAEATGGSGSYDYTLEKYNGSTWTAVSGYSHVSTTTYTGLTAGEYRVVVTDLNGCDGATTGNIEVEEPAMAVMVDNDYADISCNGAADGVIAIWPYGGTAPYQYKVDEGEWRDVPTSGEWIPNTDEKIITVTEPGDYMVYVRDANGCTAEGVAFTINEPDPVQIDVQVEDVTNVCSSTPDGSLTITVTGGHDDLYDVYVDDVMVATNVASGAATVVSNKGAGTYTIKAVETDTYGPNEASCEAVATAIINAPDGVSATVEVTATPKCNGDATGEIQVSGIAGGTGPYSVSITPAATPTVAGGVYTFSNLAAGSYTVTVEDDLGCQYKTTVKVEEPTALSLQATKVQDITCTEQGKFSVEVSGGTAPYKYFAAISQLPAHILLPEPTSDQWHSENEFMVDEAGTYIVWAMDANGCVIGGEEDDMGNPVNEWRVKIAKPSYVITVNASTEGEVLCNGGTDVTINVAPVVTMDGNTIADPVYTVTINGEEITGDKLENVGAGSYEIVVTHESGCTGTETVVVTEPEPLQIVSFLPGEGYFTCADQTEGYVEATVTGGTKLNPGIKDTDPETYAYTLLQDGVVKTELSYFRSFLVEAGHDYQVIVEDANGCRDTSDVLTIEPVKPVTFGIKDVSCFNEAKASAKVTVDGEAGRNFTLYWEEIETGNTGNEIIPESGYVLSQMFEYDEQNVTDRHYKMWVEDSEGCMSELDTLTFHRVSNPLQIVNLEQVAGECATEVSFEVAGGSVPYLVMVDGDTIQSGVSFEQTVTVSLPGGDHTIVVKDMHECMVDSVVTVEFGTVHEASFDVYEGEKYPYTYTYDGVEMDTMLSAGVNEWVEDAACPEKWIVTVNEVANVAPVLTDATPNNTTITDNHAVLVMTFDKDVKLVGAGKVYLTKEGESAATIEIDLAEGMIAGNVVTVDYDYNVVGKLDINTTYVVTVDGVLAADEEVYGTPTPWAGVSDDSWKFTTGANFATAIDNPAQAVEFKVYPNPFNNEITIDNADQLDRVIVSNVAGQRVIDIEYPSHTIGTSKLVSGVYVVTLISNNEIVKSERIIKR